MVLTLRSLCPEDPPLLPVSDLAIPTSRARKGSAKLVGGMSMGATAPYDPGESLELYSLESLWRRLWSDDARIATLTTHASQLARG